MPKKRADLLLFESGLCTSRSQAQALILAGQVYVGEQRIDKPGTLLNVATALTLRQKSRYVSRGGFKLEGAIHALNPAIADRICADVGASTGGFTDCLLQHGAGKVYAIDVGQAQLDQKLQRDARVVVMDRTNARYLSKADFAEPLGLVVVDASFISLTTLASALAAMLEPGNHLLALIKPQFEVGREQAREAKGVIRDAEQRTSAIAATRSTLLSHGFELLSECDSTLPGPKGNVEHFIYAIRQ